MKSELHYFAITRRGRRDENQDAVQATGEPFVEDGQLVEGKFTLGEDGIIVAVADGVGGRPHGRDAARVGLATLCKRPLPLNSVGELEKALLLANQQVAKLATAPSGPASTVAGVSFSLGRTLVFNLGDTRVYSLDGDRPEALSIDHQSTLDRRSITRFLGGHLAQSTPSIREMPPHHHNFLICSDGLYAFLKTEDLSLARRVDPRTSLPALADLALAHGSKDNITAAYCSVRLVPGE